MNREQINYCKDLIEGSHLETLKTLYHQEYKTNKEYENNAYIFKILFTHSCLHNQLAIAKWLYEEVYVTFDFMTQSFLKPTFKYCKVKMCDKKYPIFKKWLIEIT